MVKRQVSSKSDERFMRMAIAKAEEGIKKGQTPFGACIVKGKEIISCSYNNVWKNKDITAHAEIQAIRDACQKLKTINLWPCRLYSTCEPCPMCFSACHWAKISTIVYGAHINDARRLGFHELSISNKRMKSLGHSSLRVIGGCLREETLELFRLFSRSEKGKVY